MMPCYETTAQEMKHDGYHILLCLQREIDFAAATLPIRNFAELLMPCVSCMLSHRLLPLAHEVAVWSVA